MRRPKKRRSHPKTPSGEQGKSKTNGEPKTMVIRMGAGEVGSSISQLVRDVRNVMEPNTASRLRERKSNRLRDYTTMAGPLGVTHLQLFSKSSTGNANLRISTMPAGPTFTFRIEKYSLAKDVLKSQKRPKFSGKEFGTAPLVVMNHFSTSKATEPEEKKENSVPKHLEDLVHKLFAGMFPSVSLQSTILSSVRRVVLLNRELPDPKKSSSEDDGSYILNFRHYAITTPRVGIPKSIRRINAAEKLLNQSNKPTSKSKRGSMPNLGGLDDIADYLLDPTTCAGYTSGSDSEVETDAEVEILRTAPQRVLSTKAQKRERQADIEAGKDTSHVEKRAVKLVELGPRMKLKLLKVEEGVCAGKVMWHSYVRKDRDEVKEMEEMWEKRRKEKAERKRVQRENVEAKREKGKAGGEKDEEMEDADDWDSDVFDAEDDEEEDEGDEMDVDGPLEVPVG